MTARHAGLDRRFCFKEWGDEGGVVYDVAGGDTHLLDALAMELVHMLRRHSGCKTESLRDELREIYGGELPTSVTCSLARLEDLGLWDGESR